MCGIAGIFRFGDPRDDSLVVRTMTDELEARGPDDAGVEHDEMVTLGNRRLAILDLSPAGHQPMRSADGRLLISFNGEIYNHADLRRELGLEQSDLRSTTDTEIILHAWEKWRTGALSRMVGQWAIAIYDLKERRLWLARDRFGEKPLFYHQGGEGIAFASSIHALLQCPWVPRNIDRDALIEYVTMRYVVAPRTILDGVSKLPGGHYLVADANGVDVQRWYEPHFEAAPTSKGAAVEAFDAHFTKACERCLVSDVPVALLLSDGIDSNSIRSALVQRGHEIPSFTFEASDGGSGIATEGDVNKIQMRVSADHRIETMTPAFASLTEPTGDGAALATWLLIRNARERATVFLCGHGGDEILGGYRLSQDRFRLEALRRVAWLPQAVVGQALDRHLYGIEPLAERRRAFRQSSASTAPQAARYIIHRPLPNRDVSILFGGEKVTAQQYLGSVERLYADTTRGSASLDRMQEVMMHTFLTENICTFADSVAMDSSAELRMPFLDRDLVDFVLSLPPAMRVGSWPGRTNTKRILRWWGEGRVSQDVLKLRKRAFPFGNLPALLRSHRSDLRDMVLGSTAVTAALPGAETWLQNEPDYFRGPWEGTLWALLALGIWCENVGVQ